MKKICIITIHKGRINDLRKTLLSIDNQKIKNFKNFVISPNLSLKYRNYFKKNYRIFIIGQDNSLYNAMNIGLKKTWRNFVIFINSGDIFFDNDCTKLIEKNYDNKKCLLFKTVLKYKTNVFYPQKKFFYSKNYKPHPSFIRPPQIKKKILFNEKNLINADGYWVDKNIERYSTKKVFKNLTIHYLGGLSTKPNFTTVKYYFSDTLTNGLKELIKYLLIKFVGQTKYYQLIYKFKFYQK